MTLLMRRMRIWHNAMKSGVHNTKKDPTTAVAATKTLVMAIICVRKPPIERSSPYEVAAPVAAQPGDPVPARQAFGALSPASLWDLGKGLGFRETSTRNIRWQMSYDVRSMQRLRQFVKTQRPPGTVCYSTTQKRIMG